MYSVLMGLLLLFVKVNFTLFDDSLFYISTNLLGIFLFRMGIEKMDETDYLKEKEQMWFYVVMNIIVLFCRFFEVQVHSIGLDYFESYILASTLLIAHIYVLVYPIFLLKDVVKYTTNRLNDMRSKRMQLAIHACFILTLLTFPGSIPVVFESYLWISIVFIQIYTCLKVIQTYEPLKIKKQQAIKKIKSSKKLLY